MAHVGERSELERALLARKKPSLAWVLQFTGFTLSLGFFGTRRPSSSAPLRLGVGWGGVGWHDHCVTSPTFKRCKMATPACALAATSTLW